VGTFFTERTSKKNKIVTRSIIFALSTLEVITEDRVHGHR
jgi:hypothetical protein